MSIQELIKVNTNWEELLANSPYCLKITRDSGYIMFKYNQLTSDLSNPVVQEARGIIFNEADWTCVCNPFNKFFNYGEENAASIDWNHAAITEKIDGSLMKVWFHNGEWHISTNGTIDADKAMANDWTSFAHIFREACGNLDFNQLEKDATHMFELVSPITRVVIPYEKTELYYLTSQYNYCNTEFRNEYLASNFKMPRVFHFSSLKDVVAYCSTLDWTSEGFVVYDGVNRVKVKSPAYIKAHYARNNGCVSLNSLLDIIRQNEVDEFLVYASDYAEVIEKLSNKLAVYVAELCTFGYDFTRYYNLSKKEYAAIVMTMPIKYRDFLFKRYDNHQYGVDEYVMALTNSRLITLLDLKNI